jgi:hypothetical protein
MNTDDPARSLDLVAAPAACCGTAPHAGATPGPALESTCCGTAEEAEATASCCAPGAKADALASGASCCG